MSIYVSGSVYFAGDAIELREKASFSIQRAALDNGFGITFERGFFEEKGDKYQHTFPDNRLFYELNDSPMIGNPEDLFSVNIWSRDGQSIVNEPVFSRMKRIESFLKRILENPCIERIFLEVDPCGGCFNDSEYAYHEDITVDQFTSVMTALYEKERIAVPAVQLKIALSAAERHSGGERGLL